MSDVNRQAWGNLKRIVEHLGKVSNLEGVQPQHTLERLVKFDGSDVLRVVKALAFDVSVVTIPSLSDAGQRMHNMHASPRRYRQVQVDLRPKCVDELILAARHRQAQSFAEDRISRREFWR